MVIDWVWSWFLGFVLGWVVVVCSCVGRFVVWLSWFCECNVMFRYVRVLILIEVGSDGDVSSVCVICSDVCGVLVSRVWYCWIWVISGVLLIGCCVSV